MKKKIFLNVFYNLAMIMSIYGMIWAYENSSPLIIAFFGATLAAFLYFKIQLVKSFRNDTLK